MSRPSHLASLRQPASARNAKPLRVAMTDAEAKLWYYIRARRFEGHKFRRQVPLGPYIADFVCEAAWLIVEVDGGQHGERHEHDETRTRWMSSRGIAWFGFGTTR
jgi:very-short-patch-repair endonuclease